MAEGQPRFNTEISKEYYYKYRPPPRDLNFEMMKGSDKDMQWKTFIGLKYGVVSGTLASAAMFFQGETGTHNFRNAVQAALRYGTPWVIAGPVYGLTTTAVAKIRDEEDAINHFFGGLASGSVFGSWFKKPAVGGFCACVFALSGSLIKYMTDEGWMPTFDHRKKAMLNLYRTGWFIERPDPEGIRDEDKDDTFRRYRP